MLMTPVLKEFAASNHEVLVGKVNASSESELCRSLDIRVFPQLLLFSESKELKRNVGPLSTEELIQFARLGTEADC